MIRHVVWDWNGTILDDLDLSVEICSEEFVRCGLTPLTRERYRQIFCHPVKKIYESAGIKLNDHGFSELADRFEQNYDKQWKACSPFPDVVETLQALKEQGITQSVLSALPHKMLCRCVDHFELGDFFLTVQGLLDNHGTSKVANAIEWLQCSNLASKEVLVVGDTDHDAEVAAEIGASCVLISRGYQDETKLERTGLPVLSSSTPLIDLITNGLLK